MKILILGGAGMLGHRLWIELSKDHDVWATIRSSAEALPDLPNINRGQVLDGVDVLRVDSLVRAFATAQPDVTINCVGLIKQREATHNPLLAIDLNARFPHRAAALARAVRSRFIHISTDCVFSGQKGMYTESDPTDALDHYGKSKALGEVVDQPHALTIRTSLIGREIGSKYGLIEWFLAQQGPIKGYQKAIFSGFPTVTLADILRRYILPNPDLHGLYHVSAEPISKYDLLKLAGQAFSHPIHVQPDSTVVIDRSLDSSRFRERTGFVPASWEDMITMMAKDVANAATRE